MNPRFARAIDPIFVAALRFESKIEQANAEGYGAFNTADERATLMRRIDDAESELGNRKDWELAKYAICSWIDARLINIPWKDSSWWNNNCLEQKYFRTQLAHYQFFEKASEAEALPEKDALEVFFLAVVLGFRGFYQKSPGEVREKADELGLPGSIERWSSTVFRSLQLRHGRPEIPSEVIVGDSSAPLEGSKLLLQYSMLSLILVAAAVGIGWLWLGKS